MRESRVLKTMRSGKVATCVKINLADQRNVEIAAMSGFSSASHLCTVFKAVKNITPQEFRTTSADLYKAEEKYLPPEFSRKAPTTKK